MNGDITHSEPEPPSLPRKVTIQRATEGYGFNLHGEKGIHGQYISAIDDGSPAQKNDLRVGDRVIGVNNQDVEDLPHSKVVELIRAGGDQVTLLVVDEQCDQYYKGFGIKIPQDKFETPGDRPEQPAAIEENHVSDEPQDEGPDNVAENTNEVPAEPVHVQTPENEPPPQVQEELPIENTADDDGYEEVIPKGTPESKPVGIPADSPPEPAEESEPIEVQSTTTTSASNGSETVDHSPKLDMAAARPKPKRHEVKRATQNWKQKYEDFNKL